VQGKVQPPRCLAGPLLGRHAIECSAADFGRSQAGSPFLAGAFITHKRAYTGARTHTFCTRAFCTRTIFESIHQKYRERAFVYDLLDAIELSEEQLVL